MADFTHLHVHSAYSFLDGAIHMKDLPARIAALKMDACAVTDHGNLFGAIDFYRRCKKAGIKPILGSELWVTEGSMAERETTRNHHLILIAKNAVGYSNLMYLVSMGWRQGFYHKPRIDLKLLAERTEGLIALSGCLGGEIAQHCLNDRMDEAREATRRMAAMFEKDDFYLELQHNDRDDQARVNALLAELSESEGVPLIATNNVHYMMRDDAAAHDVLQAIQHGRNRNDPTRFRRNTDAQYLRSAEEMTALFRACPQAIENTRRVTDKVDLKLKLGKPELPNFVPPDGSDLESHLRERTMAGLKRRFTEMTYPYERDEYLARLEEELGIIISMKFPGYFLIVADFINWAKANDIPVGPGRGSGAGSLVAYSLRITDLDPLPYNLLFERFLNPERVSMPDFDVDFCQARRGEVIEYVTQKYGPTRVGQIATYAQMKAKSVIKDVARCLELPFIDVNALTKLLPNTYKDKKGNVKPITIKKAIELEPKLRSLTEENPTYREVIDIALKLEGLYRQAGMHAAGVVIGNDDLWNIVPVFRGKEDELVTQFSMVDVEDAGLVKFDFLGLKTLDVIYHAERHVNERVSSELAALDIEALWKHPHVRHRLDSKDVLQKAIADKTAYVDRQTQHEVGVDLTLRIHLLPLEDTAVYRLIAKGATLGVFQLESTGFQELLKRLKPDCFEDVVAAVALYRPGPLQTGMVDDFIDCKHGRKRVSYPHPLLEQVLEPTYGGFVYQEQVMQAAQVMAKYSLGGADLLRRAMGKKKAEVMALERVKFVAGCKENEISEDDSGEVFDLMEKFAGYGFNKSHSAAYALITFQTGYLKAYYPVEFMAALLSTEAGSTENIVKYIAEAKAMKLEVLPPSVNDSDKSFTVVSGKIRFGLSAIKGLGEAALAAILVTRTERGPFSSVYDFCERVPSKQLNKKTLEVLVRSGAFDSFNKPRSQIFEALDRAIDAAKSVQRAEAAGQSSLFGTPELAEAVKPREIYDDTVFEWPELLRLKFEKQAIGFYLTGHPLDRYARDLGRLANTSIATLDSKGRRADLTLACVVTTVRERPLRDGSGRMAFVTVEDRSGAVELMVSANNFAECEAVLKSDAPILLDVQVNVDRDEDGNQRLRVRGRSARLIAEARRVKTKQVILSLHEQRIDDRRLEALKDVFQAHPGNCSVRLQINLPDTAEVLMDLPSTLKLDPTDELIDGVEQIFGTGTVDFR